MLAVQAPGDMCSVSSAAREGGETSRVATPVLIIEWLNEPQRRTLTRLLLQPTCCPSVTISSVLCSILHCSVVTDLKKKLVLRGIQHALSLPNFLCATLAGKQVGFYLFLITAQKDGAARAKGVGEKETECTTGYKSQRCHWARWPSGHLFPGAGVGGGLYS